jgi:hypothetical protein
MLVACHYKNNTEDTPHPLTTTTTAAATTNKQTYKQ